LAKPAIGAARQHAALIAAIAEHDADSALRLIHEHNTSTKPPS
jgi:DNA-binding GntR family transcriptional regulator